MSHDHTGRAASPVAEVRKVAQLGTYLVISFRFGRHDCGLFMCSVVDEGAGKRAFMSMYKRLSIRGREISMTTKRG